MLCTSTGSPIGYGNTTVRSLHVLNTKCQSNSLKITVQFND